MMFVPKSQWSTPDLDDPPPCFRQGDVVHLSYVRPEVDLVEGNSVRISNIEVMNEPVALLSTCCDLVIRNSPKRKGVIITPLRAIPKYIAKDPQLLDDLRAPLLSAVGTARKVFSNMFLYEEAASDFRSQVVFLESVVMIPYVLLSKGKKIAELTSSAREELKSRLVHHFTR